ARRPAPARPRLLPRTRRALACTRADRDRPRAGGGAAHRRDRAGVPGPHPAGGRRRPAGAVPPRPLGRHGGHHRRTVRRSCRAEPRGDGALSGGRGIMADELIEVDSRGGRVRGRRRGIPRSDVRSAAFLGIPFAQPPVGALRFAAPEPVQPWEGVRDATAYGPTPQRWVDPAGTLIPEPAIPGAATLNVSVFTPRPDAAAKLPVMVWIHGGGYVSGSPASPWYDGRAFNRDGVVTVS